MRLSPYKQHLLGVIGSYQPDTPRAMLDLLMRDYTAAWLAQADRWTWLRKQWAAWCLPKADRRLDSALIDLQNRGLVEEMRKPGETVIFRLTSKGSTALHGFLEKERLA